MKKKTKKLIEAMCSHTPRIGSRRPVSVIQVFDTPDDAAAHRDDVCPDHTIVCTWTDRGTGEKINPVCTGYILVKCEKE